MKNFVWKACVVGVVASVAMAQDWSTVPLVRHDAYQAVQANGSPAYNGTFPIRLRGVVLNNPEDWLDPTPNFIPTNWPATAFLLGGEWEIFVQAVDMPGETYDDDDFGGVAAWMGQNLGNHVANQDTSFSYTDAEWTAELDRLDYVPSLDPNDPNVYHVRAGDLVEIRARGGLFYQGKYNVNEQHKNWPSNDFEIVMIEKGFGLPEPTPLHLANLKDAIDAAIFDPTRQTGGERYQSERVKLYNLVLDDPNDWAADSDVTVLDATGRSLTLHVGRSSAFDAAAAVPLDVFHAVGFIDQLSPAGMDGYRLMVMNAADVAPACGDSNCDGKVDTYDIDAFVEALTLEPADWQVGRYCDYQAANDINRDGVVDTYDIDAFVTTLLTGVCP